MTKKALIILTIVGLFRTVFGQQLVIPEKPDEYIVEIGDVIQRQNQPSGDSVYTKFQTTWSTLTDSQKVKFISINKTLFDKKYTVHPYYSQFMNMVHHAVNTQGMTGSDLDTFLVVLDKVSNNYSASDLKLFIKTTENFLEHNIIYQSNSHTYYAYNTKIKFDFIEDTPEGADDYYVPIEEEVEEELDEEEYYEEEEDYSESFDDWDEDYEESYDDWEDEYYDDEESYDEDYSEESDDEEVDWGDEEEEETDKSELLKETVVQLAYTAPDLPKQSGAILNFFGGDIVLQTDYDSVAISNIDTASLNISTYEVIAQGGSMNWTSAGLPENVKGSFKQYVFKTSEVDINAEGVTLEYPDKLSTPVEGIFKFKSVPHDTVTEARYPRFMSYNADIKIESLGENIDYRGGFSLNGSKVFSSSVNEARSKITVRHEGVKKFTAKARYFELGDSVITGEPAAVTIYTRVDSLFHPATLINYKSSIPELVVQTDRGPFKRKPIEDNYHGFDLQVTTIYWDFNDTIIKFLNLKARHEVAAEFDSKGYYDAKEYYTLKGMYRFHPLQMAVNYEILEKTKGMTIVDLSEKYKLKLSQVEASMKGLWHRGFIDYNPMTGYIKIKEKGYHYVASRKGDEDFDNIKIESLDPGKYNAAWNTTSDELSIYGVKSVSLSDSMNVTLEPENGQLKLLKDKNMAFNGKLFTNNYTFNGRDFNFNYELYQVELTHIDSINFTVEVTDSLTGKTEKKTLDNKLSYSSGTLFLNESDNKSGAVRNPKYPYFDASHGATVFFDKPDILNGAYDRRIYFKIPPFDVDSMSNKVEESVGFEGTFISGIFPEIDEDLVMMQDYSFGFVHNAPEEGYPLYGGHGKFFGTIRLDKQGLRGQGKIVFLNTTLESTDFIFYSDSTTGIGDNIYTKAGTHPDIDSSITFPTVNGYDYTLNWQVLQDSMIVMNNAEPFVMFDSSASLIGNAIFASTGMYGDGILETEGALTISQKFSFEERRFTGRDAQFEILTEIANKPAVRSDYVKVILDFDERKAKFNPEKQGVATNEFPYLQYKTSIDEGIWDMNKRIVTMQVPEGADLKNSYFYSTHPDQDSIAFNAKEAIYSMDSLSLHVEGVPEILIADAKIIPHKNELYITENAHITTLKDCKLVVDTLNQYHKLVEGEIDIINKHKFEGNATYQYVNFGNDTLPIKFNRFDLEEENISRKETYYHTKSTGNIFQEDNFYLQPKMLYRGMATMYAQKRLLDLEGYVKLDLRGAVPPPDWLKYDQKEDIDEIQIPLEEQKTADGNPMISGIHYSVDEQALYGTFLGEKRDDNDITLFSADGYLIYDDDENFQIGEFESLKGGQFSGNTFIYNENREEFNYKGLLNFVRTTEDKKSSHVSFDMAGEGKNVILDTSYTAKGLAKIEFDIPSSVTDVLAEELELGQRYLETELSMVVADHDYLGNIAAFIGEKSTDKYAASSMVGVQPLYLADKFFSEGIVFNNLKLEWSNKYQAWYGHGPMGLGNINKTNFNLKMNSYIEIKNTEDGSIVNIYMSFDNDNWFYFAYDAFSLTTASSYAKYEDQVNSKSTQDKNEAKGLYYFATTPRSEASSYIRRFINTYLEGASGDSVPVFEDRLYEDDLYSEEEDLFLEDEEPEDEFIDDLGEFIDEEDELSLDPEDSENFQDDEAIEDLEPIEDIEETNSIEEVEDLLEELPEETPIVEEIVEEPERMEELPIEDETIEDLEPINDPVIEEDKVEEETQAEEPQLIEAPATIETEEESDEETTEVEKEESIDEIIEPEPTTPEEETDESESDEWEEFSEDEWEESSEEEFEDFDASEGF